MDQEPANRILERALARGPRCGAVILIGIDGRSGAGKTVLAEQVGDLARTRGLSTATIHNDVLCPGWNGLSAVPERLADIVRQLSTTGAAVHPTWDWIADAPGPDASVPSAEVVIIEGVASIGPEWANSRSASVWVEAPAPLRKIRAIARDGASFAAQWDHWAAAEEAYYASTPPQPDLVVEVS